MNGSEEEGTRHFMVNVIEPQFNLHSEEVNVSTCHACTVQVVHALHSKVLYNVQEIVRL